LSKLRVTGSVSTTNEPLGVVDVVATPPPTPPSLREESVGATVVGVGELFELPITPRVINTVTNPTPAPTTPAIPVTSPGRLDQNDLFVLTRDLSWGFSVALPTVR